MADLDLTGLRLSAMTNVEMLELFKHDFLVINDYVPSNQFDKTQIFQYSKCFIDDFKRRVSKDSLGQIVDFAQMIQQLMKNDATIIDSYYTRTLLRLYSYAVAQLRKSEIPDAMLTKDFL